MPIYKAPVNETMFVLNDVLGLERYNNLPGFAEATADMVEAIAGEAARLSEEVLFPVNLSGDQEGCTRGEDGSVRVPKGFKEAFNLYREGGWLGLAVPEAFGGRVADEGNDEMDALAARRLRERLEAQVGQRLEHEVRRLDRGVERVVRRVEVHDEQIGPVEPVRRGGESKA